MTPQPPDQDERLTVAAGHAAGYCWGPVPGDRGRCTWPPGHDADLPHRDAYHPSERGLIRDALANRVRATGG